MIPVTYPSSVSTSKESQMVVFALSSVTGLRRWTDYIPVKYQSTGSDVPNSFNTNGYIACDFITNLTGKQAWVDYVPVFVDNLATTAWQVSDTGFIPFNTLAGGGTYVSLDLNFLNTTALDSRITFSRGTNATLTGSNGLIQYAPHNLLTNSEDFEAAVWIKVGSTVTANATVAPDGATTADKLVENTSTGAHVTTQNASLTSGVSYTFSAYVKAAERTRLWFERSNATLTAFTANVDISTGTVVSSTGSVTVSVTPAGNGFYRVSLTVLAASTASGGVQVGLVSTGSTISYTGDGTSGIFIWGAQLNVGALQTYNPTTPKNLLGFTQEPENAAWTKSNSYVQQNLLTWSQDFDNAAWTATRSSITTDASTAPDGAATADKLVEDTTASSTHVLLRTVSVSPSTTYTATVYVKAAERTRVDFNFGGTRMTVANGGTGADISTVFDLSAGEMVVGTGTAYNPQIISVGNGWYRISITGTTGSAGSGFIVNLYLVSSGTTTSYTGDGTSGIFIWGAQLVQGSTAGDYTQTTSAAAPTRYLNWDGTLTGRKLVEDTANATHRVGSNAPVLTGNTPHTFSFYAKAAERTEVYGLIAATTAGSRILVRFDLLNENVVVVSGTPLSTSVQAVGSGWYYCAITYTTAASPTSTSQIVGIWNGAEAYTGDGTSGIYVSDFQLSNSASVDPYVYNPQAAAASAAYYGPRFDYDPVTLASRGLLIEEQRTNLLTYSEQFDNAAWTKISGGTGSVPVVTADAGIAPDGTTTADLIVFDRGAGNAGADFSAISRSVSGLTAAASYTGTVYLKAATAGDVGKQLAIRNVAGAGYAIITLTDSWQRAPRTETAGATTGVFDITNRGTFTNANSVSAYVWGAQLEAGSFATSYIPTVASQVTRNADSASMLGDNFYTWYNPNQGTLSVETGSTADSVYPTGAVLTDGTTSNNILIQGSSPATSQQFYVISGGVAQVNLATQTFSSTLTKTAAAYKANDFAYSTQGAAVSTDVTGSVPTVSQLVVGAERTSNLFNGTIRRINYYNTRLDNATLQALTT